MNAVLSLNEVARRQDIADAAIAALAAKVARMAAIQVGTRVVSHAGGVTLHGVVVELARNAEDVACAWIRVIGHPAWHHCEKLSSLRAVCGACDECQSLNDRPRCAYTETQGVAS
jgi:hypothetical protein